MEQLILHLIGDYVTQSDWMANNKTKSVIPAAVHALVYSLPFLLLRPSALAFTVICVTHFIIDHWRLARYVVWLKNFIAPNFGVSFDCPNTRGGDCTCPQRWENCKATGYPSELPPFMAIWLMIIADNTMHLAINYLSLRYL
jgi:hypothetical protein